MDLEIADETYTFAEDADHSRYTVSHDGTIIGEATYATTASGERIFDHTEVDPSFGGRGIAGHLVRFALESTTEAGVGFRATCSYVVRFLEKNPEFTPAA